MAIKPVSSRFSGSQACALTPHDTTDSSIGPKSGLMDFALQPHLSEPIGTHESNLLVSRTAL